MQRCAAAAYFQPSALVSRRSICRSTSGKTKLSTRPEARSKALLPCPRLASISALRRCASSAATARQDSATVSSMISERYVSAEPTWMRMIWRNTSCASARAASSTALRPDSSASRVRRSFSALATSCASRRSSLKARSSLAMVSSATPSTEPMMEPPTPATASAPAWASTAVASSAPPSSERSSSMRSSRRSLPWYIMFCTARPRSSRWSRMVAA
mmetsp:Transcript_34463/g.111229  ORF Transcript_34463/g.111229 Transcript_34463/m.111229 type:complete len:216 (+) Transcript_34463:297-944(+)